jgi:hypothetical protein
MEEEIEQIVGRFDLDLLQTDRVSLNVCVGRKSFEVIRPQSFFAFDGMHLVHNAAEGVAEIKSIKESFITAQNIRTKFGHKN